MRVPHSCLEVTTRQTITPKFPVTAQFLLSAVAHFSASLAFSSHTYTHTQSANQRSEKGHLCLPGLPGDKEEAVVRGIDPVGTSLADHYSAAGVSTAAVAAVMLQKKTKKHIILLQQAVTQVYMISFFFFFHDNKTPTRRGPPVVPGFSAKKTKQDARYA